MTRRAPLLAAIALIAVCGACGDDDDDGTASSDEVRDTCNAMVQLQLVVEEAAGADVDLKTVNVGDLNRALDRLGTMVENVQSIGIGLDESVTSELKDAFANLQKSVSDLPADATLADARGDVPEARAEFKTAWDDTLAALDCPTPPTTTT
jgi:hypothetical protein